MSEQSKVFRVGTLTYTRPALAVLFFWLLWGDFCYMLMETVTPSIMPLRFKDLGATNTEMGLIIGTIPGIIYTVLNPVISFKSDRFRSRWGRRIPFILCSLPFLVSCLVLLAFNDRIGFWFHEHLFGADGAVSARRVAIWTTGLFLVVFTFFNTFVTSTFWYLFNDVVPEHLLARFMSWFRIISMGAGALYNFCIFKYAGTHATEIFLGAAVLYGVGFTLMCLNVREGEYPPPPPYVGGQAGPLAAIKTYGKECHAFPHYWHLWICTFIGAIGGGVATFGLLFSLAVGLNLEQIGRINGTVSIVVGVLILGSGWLADRFHPIRVVIVGSFLGLAVVTPASLVWLLWHPSPAETWTFHLGFLQHLPWLDRYATFEVGKVFLVAAAIAVGLGAPVAALNGVWDPPMLMRLFPRERYGQFCSTNAIWRSAGGILGGFLAGGFLDVVTHWVGSKDLAYFYIPFWQLAFAIPSFFVLLRLYKTWKQHGGDDAYVAPRLELATAGTMPKTPYQVPGMEAGDEAVVSANRMENKDLG